MNNLNDNDVQYIIDCGGPNSVGTIIAGCCEAHKSRYADSWNTEQGTDRILLLDCKNCVASQDCILIAGIMVCVSRMAQEVADNHSGIIIPS